MTDALATVPHVGLTVTDPEVSRQWYQRLFNAAPVLAGAAMRPLPGAGRLPGPGHLSKKPISTGQPVTLRWILFHLIEETARHNGHLDLLRELADGVIGT
jgi:hypothetical protein